jgi:hypothetical protein
VLRCRLFPNSDLGVPRLLVGVLGVRGVPTCAAFAAGDNGPKLCGDETWFPADDAWAMELATDLGEDAIEIFLVGKFAERFSLGKEKKPFGFFLSGAAHGPGSRAQAET